MQITISKHAQERHKQRIHFPEESIIQDILLQLEEGHFFISMCGRFFYVKGYIGKYVLDSNLEVVTIMTPGGKIDGHYVVIPEALGVQLQKVFRKGAGGRNTAYFLERVEFDTRDKEATEAEKRYYANPYYIFKKSHP